MTKSIYVFSARPMQNKHVTFKKNAIPIIYSLTLNTEDVNVQVHDIALPPLFTYPDLNDQPTYHLHRYDINTEDYEWFVKNVLTMYTQKIPTQWLAYWLRSFIKAKDRQFLCSFDGDDIGVGADYFPPGYITIGAPLYQMFVGIPPDDNINWMKVVNA